jgi:hypothetical protein
MSATPDRHPRRCVALARWCQKHGIDPFDAAELFALAGKWRATGQVRYYHL